MDTTACVELHFSDGSMVAISTIAVENEVADSMYQRSELDWLIYNRPLFFALPLGKDFIASSNFLRRCAQHPTTVISSGRLVSPQNTCKKL